MRRIADDAFAVADGQDRVVALDDGNPRVMSALGRLDRRVRMQRLIGWAAGAAVILLIAPLLILRPWAGAGATRFTKARAQR